MVADVINDPEPVGVALSFCVFTDLGNAGAGKRLLGLAFVVGLTYANMEGKIALSADREGLQSFPTNERRLIGLSTTIEFEDHTV